MSNVPPPVVTYGGESKQRVTQGADRALSAIPTIAIPFLLPILIPLWIYVRIHRRMNLAAVLEEERLVREEQDVVRDSALSALCSGSGRVASETDTNWPVCGTQIGTSSGRVMTHS
jgi:hypothetical protein